MEQGHHNSTKMLKIPGESSDFVNIFDNKLLTFVVVNFSRTTSVKEMINKNKYSKSSISLPLGGAYLFQACLRRSLINLTKMMVSVLHKNWNASSGARSWGSYCGRSKTTPNFQHLNSSYQISPYKVFHF